MAFVHKAVDPESLRAACFVPDATGITAYDADFPSEAGQQFVEAVVTSARGTEETFDLTNLDYRWLNQLIEQEAEAACESVKFALDLGEVPEVITLDLEIENHYDGDQVDTTATVIVPPPPEDEGERSDWEADYIMSATGTGRTEGNSAYFVEVTKSSHPDLIPVGTEYEFGL